MAGLRAELKDALHEFQISTIKWAVGIAFGQLTVLAGFCYFLVSHLSR